jgi:hypothetical protein
MCTNWYDLAKRWTDRCTYCKKVSYAIVGSVCNECRVKDSKKSEEK